MVGLYLEDSFPTNILNNMEEYKKQYTQTDFVKNIETSYNNIFNLISIYFRMIGWSTFFFKSFTTSSSIGSSDILHLPVNPIIISFYFQNICYVDTAMFIKHSYVLTIGID